MAVSGAGIGPGPHTPTQPPDPQFWRRRGVGFFRKVAIILEMIKFEHTIFALPFALISMLLASRSLPHGLPGWRTFGWILAAMVGARSAAMSFNRIVDARFDAFNPRTAKRAIPSGLLNNTQVAIFTSASILLFLLAAFELNPLCLGLAPIALLVILGYSYAKRFTSLSHLLLGLGIGIAPVGAWLAVTVKLNAIPILLWLAVSLWIGGFDIIYALQDVEFDRQLGLYSLPRKFGKANALSISRAMHMALIVLLAAIGVIAHMHLFYFLGVAVAAVLITYEQSIVSPNDLSRVNIAFFTLNGWVSVALLLFVVLDLAAFRQG